MIKYAQVFGGGGVLIMASTLEHKLDALVHEIRDIKKRADP
jgi:hypothetical protein